MWPCCCAGWISTVWPLEMAGEEDVDADASLCPVAALDIEACRVSGGPWVDTDWYLQSLFSFSQVLHLVCPGEPASQRIFRRRQHALSKALIRSVGQKRRGTINSHGQAVEKPRGCDMRGFLAYCRLSMRGGSSTCSASFPQRWPSSLRLRRMLAVPS